MNFVKDSVNQEPIVDTVFVIVDAAKKAKEKFGEDAVVDATIGRSEERRVGKECRL